MEATVIDKAKQYTTRDGRSVRIYATDHAGDYPVHGAIETEDGWTSEAWCKNGRYLFDAEDHERDLVEARPQHTKWLVVSPKDGFNSREDAVVVVGRLSSSNYSIVQVTWREGDGL